MFEQILKKIKAYFEDLSNVTPVSNSDDICLYFFHKYLQTLRFRVVLLMQLVNLKLQNQVAFEDNYILTCNLIKKLE